MLNPVINIWMSAFRRIKQNAAFFNVTFGWKHNFLKETAELPTHTILFNSHWKVPANICIQIYQQQSNFKTI